MKLGAAVAVGCPHATSRSAEACHLPTRTDSCHACCCNLRIPAPNYQWSRVDAHEGLLFHRQSLLIRTRHLGSGHQQSMLFSTCGPAMAVPNKRLDCHSPNLPQTELDKSKTRSRHKDSGTNRANFKGPLDLRTLRLGKQAPAQDIHDGPRRATGGSCVLIAPWLPRSSSDVDDHVESRVYLFLSQSCLFSTHARNANLASVLMLRRLY